ncbi:hypothetical protein ACFSTI_20505 [Rhizorhabdus histidinilytica]|uniref:DNA-binding transcriptional repressor CapW winged helix-turn-helix domain-containing protein n=1 Tax=Rhizorhabdus histidinilytica TaxID=439228 RepID=A0A1T5BQ70_9SPHN|nr:hypothetical protein [Rhizorhabdus histidinilytica]SKB49378.1 hypothetical protein SAMN06295920_103196 [Rhizorhabdus histidinilytica]
MTWFTERRLDWIEDRLFDYGRLNRDNLIQYFGISMPQASMDIQAYLALNADVIYDKRAKHYCQGPDFKPVRGSTALRRRTWDAWPVNHQSWCPDADDHRPGIFCAECAR